MNRPPPWPPEDDARLRQLWAEGLPIRAIGKEIGRTHNSVVGRARRMKLTPRGSPLHPPSGKPRARPTRAPLPAAPPVVLASVYPGPRDCQWPTTNDKPWRFCAAPVAKGRPYCHSHSLKAYLRRAA